MSNNPDVGKVFNLTGGNGGDGSLKLEGLSITNPPLKTTYKSGQSFDPTGMVVTALYAYGITSDVTGYTVSPNVLTDDVSQVTVTYTEGRFTKMASVNVTVEKVLSSINVTTPPTKAIYNYLETFDPAGMAVTAMFSDGSTSSATGYGYPTTAFSTLGQQAVNLDYTYEGVTKSTTLNVMVQAIEVAAPTQKDIPTYDGTQKIPVWNGYDSVKMTLDGDTSGVNAKDNYSATFTLIYGYVFPDGASSATVNWAINRAVIESVPTQIDIPAADGSPKSPSWNGYDPAKMTIGGDRTGIAAGEYPASFTPTANYQWWDGTIEAKSVTWVIASILVTIPTQKNIPTYDGSKKAPEWDNFDTENSTVQVTEMTDAGEHEATFTLLRGMWSDNTTDPKTVMWKINRASIATVPQQVNTPVYDGNPHSPTWDTNYSSVKMTVDVEAAVNAGTDYPASFTPTSNYQWWDGTITEKSVAWVINRASITTVPSQSGTLAYSGNEQFPNWSDYDSTQLTLGGETVGTNAGNYNATFTPTMNYKWSDAAGTGAKTVTWTINVKSLAVPSSTVLTFTYNGTPQGPVVSGYDSNTMNQTGDVLATVAGSYTVTYALKDKTNYQWADGTTTDKSISWVVNRAKLTIPTSSNTTFTYNGSSQAPTVAGYDSNTMDQSGVTSSVNAGSFTITYSLKDTTNYEWSDSTQSNKTINWTVNKAAGSLTVSPTSVSLTKDSKTSEITVTRLGDGAVWATSSNTSIATVSVSGTTVTVTGVANGDVVITIGVNAGTNYASPPNKAVSVNASVADVYTELYVIIDTSIRGTLLSAPPVAIIDGESVYGVANGQTNKRISVVVGKEYEFEFTGCSSREGGYGADDVYVYDIDCTKISSINCYASGYGDLPAIHGSGTIRIDDEDPSILLMFRPG